MAGQKVVIKLEVNGERPTSIAKKIGVGMLKAMMPFKCVSENFKHSASQNKRKAMQIAVGFPGVNSAGIEGDDELVVKGVLFDAVELVNELREKVGGASIKTIGKEDENKKGETKEENNNNNNNNKALLENPAVVHPWPYHPPLLYMDVPDYYHSRGCFF